MKYWIMLALAVAANVLANLALKLAARDINPTLSVSSLMEIASKPWLWVGVTSAGLLLMFYLHAIKGIDLVLAYAVVTSLALVFLTILSSVIFGSPLTWSKFAGIFLVVGGVCLLHSS